MLKDHPDAAELNLADIRIVVESVVVWGAFAPPVESERTTFSLATWRYKTSLPANGQQNRVQSQRQPGAGVDDGKLSGGADHHGRHWPDLPALIKSKLRDDSLESLRRQNLFTSRLRVELPLLALQQKIRAQAGIDETGIAISPPSCR
jgi:hypothetical protein